MREIEETDHMNKEIWLDISVFIFTLLALVVGKYLSNPKVVGDVASNGLTKSFLQTAEKETMDDPIQEVATNLEIPWEIIFLPDQSLLVTQRPGSLVHI